ncbi:MAG: Foldase protein prsA 4 precursor 5, partial [Labilithrix sp.]|nr:Foldase protein prsA 4 precursor 5 [Labilithrix sp.]
PPSEVPPSPAPVRGAPPAPTAASPVVPVLAAAPARRPLPPGESIRASHILVAYAGAMSSEQTRSREEARARAEECLQRVRQGEDFVQLAAEYGDDATRARGGELGAFSRARFPAPFTSAAFALEPGGTSDIVETRYGFHIIRRTE